MNDRNDTSPADIGQLAQRLAELTEASAGTSAEDQLRKRAEQYARVIDDDGVIVDGRTLLVFQLGGERYAVPIGFVTAVRDIPAVTRIPNAPVHLPGVVNIHGVVVTLLDLRQLMSLGATQDSAELVMIEGNGLRLGLMVHFIEEVVTIPQSALAALDDTRFAEGIFGETGQQVVLLDLQRIFDDERLQVQE